MMYWTKILHKAGITLWMCPANERWRYNVTSSLIGWAHAQNAAWKGCIQTPLSSQLLCMHGGSQSDSLHEFKWLFHILPLLLWYRIQYQVISNNVIMKSTCIYNPLTTYINITLIMMLHPKQQSSATIVTQIIIITHIRRRLFPPVKIIPACSLHMQCPHCHLSTSPRYLIKQPAFVHID